jgi:hypothetical protein
LYGPNNLRKGQATNWALSSFPISLGSWYFNSYCLVFGWAAVNSGSTGDHTALVNNLSDAAATIALMYGQPEVAIIAKLGGLLGSFLTADCDCPLFAEVAAEKNPYVGQGTSFEILHGHDRFDLTLAAYTRYKQVIRSISSAKSYW